MATCNQIDQMIQAYIDDELGRVDRVLFEEHLVACVLCQKELQEARTCAVHLHESLHRDRRTVDLTSGIMAHLPEMKRKKLNRQEAGTSSRSNPDFGKDIKRNLFARYMPVYVPAVLLIVTLLLWLQWPDQLDKSVPSLGVVTQVSGTSYRYNESSTTRARRVRTEDILTAGDQLETDSHGKLLLGLKGPSHLAVYPNSSVRIETDRKVTMDRGSMFLDVFKDVRRFTINTPHGCVTVMGTSFHIQIADQSTEVSVVDGDVLVENDRSFARLIGGKKAFFQKDSDVHIAYMADTDTFVEQARSLMPDIQAERFFLSELVTEPLEIPRLSGEQVFVVKTGRRTVKNLLLRWVPDPYLAGHAAYTVYISDNAMRPIYKYSVLPVTFAEKTRNTLEINMPLGQKNFDMSILHVSVLPVQGSGYVETSFTEVLAVGEK